MAHKIVLIGAGSANFGLSIMGDLFKSEVFAGAEICLHDINAEALARTASFGRRHIEKYNLPYKLEATTDRRAALQGADFCIISIEVGNRFELWEQDWRIPQQFGIRQVYGENGGPGGLFHALRVIPPILAICDDIMAICPDAWVLNFSNPMSRICTTVQRKHPDLKLIGVCHEAASLPEHLPHILETPLENLRFQAGGLNHFSVLLNVFYRDTGADAYPDVRARAPAYFERITNVLGWALPSLPAEHVATVGHRPWAERGLFKVILERFGYLPVTVDSHFGEYIQWAHDVVDHAGILDFYRTYKLWVAQKVSEETLLRGSGDDWVTSQVLESIAADRPTEVLALNLPNRGFIDDLPSDITVEVPACVDGSGVHGVALGRFPRGIAGLLRNQIAVHDLTAEAVLTRSKAAALQALLVDPVVDSVRAAEQTLETMLRVQRRWLGYLE
uniref:Alpha-glucosidase n=1 Tax=Caldilinea aerophila TaxID=133453 RepID=A0A7C1FDN9_9CHLR